MSYKRKEVIGDCVLYEGDCLEVMQELEPVDAVVTDPPYGVGFNYNSYDDDPERHQEDVQQWLNAINKTCKGPVCVFCGIRQMWNYPKPHWVCCWRKTFSVTLSPFGANNWEPMLVYNKGRKADRHSDSFEATFMPDNLAKKHPCPKPVKAMQEAILMVSKQNETILDPFMGSGTTGVACARLGRQFIGIELDPHYFDIACQRIEEAYQQPDMFIEQQRRPEPEQSDLI